MAAREQRDQGLLDDLALAEDDLADAVAHQAEAFAERFDRGDQIPRIGVDGCGGSQALIPFHAQPRR